MRNIFKQLTRNIFSSWTALAIKTALVFFVNPFIIHSLGNEQYGLWTLILSLITYMTILDLGLQQALIRFISKYLGLGDFKKINSILNTAFLICLGTAFITVVFALILSFFALDMFKIPPDLLILGRRVLLIIALHTAINFMFLSWGGSLGAFHRYDIFHGLTIVENVLRTITIVVLLKSGYGLISFALTFPVFCLLRHLAGTIILKKLYPSLKIGTSAINKESFRLLFNYGKISFLISVIWLLIANTDHVLIGYFLNTETITLYAIAGSIIIFLRNFIHAVAYPLQPVVSHYDTLNQRENIRDIYMKGIKYLSFLTFSVGGGIIFFADSFMILWMGPGYELSSEILKILIIPAALFLPQEVALSILYGIEKHRNILYIVLLEGTSNLILSILLVGSFGVFGIAYGTIIPQFIIYLCVLPLIICKILELNISRYYISLLKSAGLGFIVTASLSYIFILILKPNNWGYFMLEVIVIGLLTLLAGSLIVDKSDWGKIREELFRSDSNKKRFNT